MKKVRLLLISLIGVAILQSCMKKSDFDFSKMVDPVYNGEWAVPIASSHITLRDILKNQSSAIQTDQQGLVTLVYNLKNLTSVTADQLMKIPNQNFSVPSISIPTTIPNTNIPLFDLTPGHNVTLPTLSADVPLTMASATQIIESVYTKTGILTIPINTNFNKTTTIKILAPNIIKRSTNTAIDIPAFIISNGNRNTTINIDISNCILLLKTTNGVHNTLHFDVNLTMQGDPVPMPANYTFNMGLVLSNLQFERLYGNLGQFNMNLSQMVDISVFKNNLGGDFQFGPNAIKLKLNIDNSFGLPLQIKTTTLTAHSDINTPHDVPIKFFANTDNTFLVNAQANIGDPARTTSFLSDNPNISDAFNILPDKISFVANALTNPTSPVSQNFVTDKSSINVNMDIMLSLNASIKDFAFQDTLSFDLKNVDQLESLSFNLNTTNGFPIGAKMQIFFTDENYNQLDAMFATPQDILKPAIVSGTPETITPTSYHFPEIIYDQARLNKIKSAKKIIIKAILNTPNNGMFKIYDSYYIDTKIAVRAKAKLQSSSN